MNVEEREKAMDLLMADLRTNERDVWYDSETERYEAAMHEPHQPMGGAEHDRP